MTPCGSKYMGFTCQRESGHETDLTLIDRELCWARWGDRWLEWRYPEIETKTTNNERKE